MRPTVKEIWKPIPGFRGRYEVSSFGHVRSFVSRFGKRKTPRLLSPGDRINLRKGGKIYPWRTCYVVALAFIGPRPKGKWILHFDDDRSNNKKTNLRYGTPKDNSDDAKRNGSPVGRPREYIWTERDVKEGHARPERYGNKKITQRNHTST